MTRERVFEYLDDLRESGRTNMFGAASYIEAELGLSRAVARERHIEWMKSFAHDKTAAERAAQFDK